MKYVAPSVHETAFNCPHCGALTSQTWHRILSLPRDIETPLPKIWTKHDAASQNFEDIPDPENRHRLKILVQQLADGIPIFHENTKWISVKIEVSCLHISECFNCKELAIWVHDRLMHPATGEAPPPNPDLPANIRADYVEANSILNLSPRGAAALLRLAIQKLCVEFGETGKDINKDIGNLVQKGLDIKIQKALDIVRVIGNEAVHPGTIDLKDDAQTALALFRLVNLITERMISEAKEIDALFNTLPESKLQGIEARDKPKNGE